MIDPTAGPRGSQAQRIARTLIDRIRDGTYAVGEKIPSERQLVMEFGLSRPVVREALSTVSALGILQTQMGRGAFVTGTPNADLVEGGGVKLQDVVNVREVLEVGAINLAARNGGSTDGVQVALERLRDAVHSRENTVEPDRALHAAVVLAAKSPLLASLWQGIDRQVVDTIRISPHGDTMSSEILALHDQLAEGLISGNYEKAIDASRQLHEDNRQFLRGLLQ